MKRTRAFKSLQTLVNLLSLEFLLTRFKWPNGGTVIFLRAIGISAYITLMYGALVQVVDPDRVFQFSFKELSKQTVECITIYGPVFAAIYIALYSRFSSQWAYLANLYNQIKQTEATPAVDKTILDHWKAAFIEDADELHLSLKPMFAIIIRAWACEQGVRTAFEEAVPDGQRRINDMLSEIQQRLSLLASSGNRT